MPGKGEEVRPIGRFARRGTVRRRPSRPCLPGMRLRAPRAAPTRTPSPRPRMRSASASAGRRWASIMRGTCGASRRRAPAMSASKGFFRSRRLRADRTACSVRPAFASAWRNRVFRSSRPPASSISGCASPATARARPSSPRRIAAAAPASRRMPSCRWPPISASASAGARARPSSPTAPTMSIAAKG